MSNIYSEIVQFKNNFPPLASGPVQVPTSLHMQPKDPRLCSPKGLEFSYTEATDMAKAFF